jgi:pantothenate kinase type III
MRAPARRTTDYLLIDISNSYTKLAFATTRRLAKPMRLPTNDLTVAALRRILGGRSVETIS